MWGTLGTHIEGCSSQFTRKPAKNAQILAAIVDMTMDGNALANLSSLWYQEARERLLAWVGMCGGTLGTHIEGCSSQFTRKLPKNAQILAEIVDMIMDGNALANLCSLGYQEARERLLVWVGLCGGTLGTHIEGCSS